MAADLKSRSPFLDVAAKLRRRIVAGDWAPGTRLPTWDHMAKEFEIARPTLMRAMDRLRQDGFVYAKSTRGTYVSDKPPHLSRFGLVFTSHPGAGGERHWNRFWDTLANQAPIVERDADVKVPAFFDVLDRHSEGHRDLIAQVDNHCLGGLILVGTPELMASPQIARMRVPKVAIYDGPTDAPIPRVYIDHQSFIDQSLDRLVALGRRRIAVLSNTSDRFAGYEPAMAGRDVQTKPFWRLAAAPAAAANVVRLLFDPDNAAVPDGLVITDDNIVEQALAGLLQSEVRVPAQLEVVAHCNWPAPVPSPVPVHRLGYDVRQMLHRSIEGLVQQRSGNQTAQVHLISALWEGETASSDPSQARLMKSVT